MLSRLLLTVAILLMISGCSTVKPWERGNLAQDIMAWQPDPLKASLDNHIHFSKEGSSGGGQAAGGGCGCN
ncbi:MAG: hypothetical protein COB09_16720 [Thalassobium sp.]|jgi:hypothetical protein|uniref:DUF4266 domain-containing protein n=1 Tax=Thalassolituus pacificus TaxID=2975440 RepID=A0A9X2WC59_9GAMM|nr:MULTISPECIES: DUF4266 domain-containing protein [Thalassolituus]MAY15556.1 hypothetical protein [Oceanospirillaceae bacterium]MBU2037544.1 DUF4266 domain-containing protein [Gammaproteobacteria bacterium]PHS61860.1 MAG: hypothetical protein COB09_16720 [Thalassobium sp.]MCT7357660.1 DUF4266 domain-containing protein [Thalassolituus pacificus]TVV39612.1 DUF4266 domain-containing protein [Thalassolituus sp. C2-1]|tara:strand:- start:1172 stop:1384 length:213 start_codon:yes stop_codon:yes gene_type:complete